MSIRSGGAEGDRIRRAIIASPLPPPKTAPARPALGPADPESPRRTRFNYSIGIVRFFDDTRREIVNRNDLSVSRTGIAVFRVSEEIYDREHCAHKHSGVARITRRAERFEREIEQLFLKQNFRVISNNVIFFKRLMRLGVKDLKNEPPGYKVVQNM